MLQLKTIKFNKLIVSVLIVTIMLYARDLFGVNISPLVFAVIAIGLALPMAYNDFMCYLFFLFPIGNGIPESYLMFVFVLLWFIKRKGPLNAGSICFFIIIAFFEVVHFMGYSFKHDTLMLVRYLSCFFLFVVCINDKMEKENHNKRALCFIVGTFVALICIIINTYLLGGFDVDNMIRVGEFQELDEDFEDKIMISMNPNGMSFIANTSIAVLFSLYFSQFLKRIWIIVVLFVIFFIAIVLSISRTGVIVLILSVLLFLLGRTGFRRGNTPIVLFVVLVGGLLLLSNSFLLDNLLGRFADDTVSTAGSRTNIFSLYNNFLINNPIYLTFGTGAVYYKDVTQIFSSTHNSIQQILISYGIIGLIVFLVASLNLYKRFKGRRFFIWIPVIVVLFNMQMIQFLMPFAYMYPIVAAFEVVKGAPSKYELSEK